MKIKRVTITRTRTVSVYADTNKEAIQCVEGMYLSGDACAELLDASYKVKPKKKKKNN